MRQIQGKLVLLRVSREFELPRVRVIGVQLYYPRLKVRDFMFNFDKTSMAIRFIFQFAIDSSFILLVNVAITMCGTREIVASSVAKI